MPRSRPLLLRPPRVPLLLGVPQGSLRRRRRLQGLLSRHLVHLPPVQRLDLRRLVHQGPSNEGKVCKSSTLSLLEWEGKA